VKIFKFGWNPKLKTYWSASFLQLENHYEIGELFKCRAKKGKKKNPNRKSLGRI
jgi:hypothetical protein